MRSRISRRGFLTATGGLALSLAAPARAQFTGEARHLTIAVSVTQADAAVARAYVSGVKAAVANANMASGGIGTEFDVKVYDDEDKIGTSIQDETVVEFDDPTIVMIGYPDEDLVTATIAENIRYQVPLIVPTVTEDAALQDNQKTAWRMLPTDTKQGTLFANFLPKLAAKNVVYLDSRHIRGQALALYFGQALKAAGTSGTLVSIANGHLDEQQLASALAQADTLMLFCLPDEIESHFHAPAFRQFRGTIVAGHDFFDDAHRARLAALGVKAYVGTPMPPLIRAASIARQVFDLQAAVGTVTPTVAFTYAAAQVAIQAQQNAGAFSKADEMRSLRSPATYNTILGPISFDDNGEVRDPNLYLYAVQPERFRYDSAAVSTDFIS